MINSSKKMHLIGLEEFFKILKYDYLKDFEKIKEICRLTKTRTNDQLNEINMPYGSEQPFLIKALVKKINARNFFEIGTGRGTASYSVALEKSIELIVTIDKIPHFYRQKTSIGYKPIKISQRGINKLITFEEKEKIKFFHVSQKQYLKTFYKNNFDIAFIDGNHTNKRIIKNDIKFSLNILKNNGLLIFDDYENNNNKNKKFSVGEVVDEFLCENNYYKYLIEFRGHLFEKTRKENNTGILIVSPYDFLAS